MAKTFLGMFFAHRCKHGNVTIHLKCFLAVINIQKNISSDKKHILTKNHNMNGENRHLLPQSLSRQILFTLGVCGLDLM